MYRNPMLHIAFDGGRQLLIEGRRQVWVLVDGLHQLGGAAGEHHIRHLRLACALPATLQFMPKTI